MFDFETRLMSDGIAVVSVKGSLNEEKRQYFFNCVGELFNDGYSRIIIECDGLGFVSSSGLAGLIRARRHVRSRGGRIYLTHLNSTITEILHITKLNKLFAIHPTTRELFGRLQSSAVKSASRFSNMTGR